jgi:hypothetical protein
MRFWGVDEERLAGQFREADTASERSHLRQVIWPKVDLLSRYACKWWGGYVTSLGLAHDDLRADLSLHLIQVLETRFDPDKGTAYGFLIRCSKNFVTNWVEPRYARPRLRRTCELPAEITEAGCSPLERLLTAEAKHVALETVETLRERLKEDGCTELDQILAGFQATEELTGWERSRRFREFIPKDRYTYFLKKSRKCLGCKLQ